MKVSIPSWSGMPIQAIINNSPEINQPDCFMPPECMDIQYIFYRPLNMCFKLHTDRTNWTSAAEKCAGDGGRLVQLDTKEKIDFMVDFTNQYYGEAFLNKQDFHIKQYVDN